MIKLVNVIKELRNPKELERLKNEAIELFKKDKNRIGKSIVWHMLIAGGDNWIDTHKDGIIESAISQIKDDPDLADGMFGEKLTMILLKIGNFV